MSRDVGRIIYRLEEAGIRFPQGRPDRAHYKCRGQIPNTWLVRKGRGASGRPTLSEWLGWELHGGTGSEDRERSLRCLGQEIILDLPAREIARTDCLVAYKIDRDPMDLCLTSLDQAARLLQLQVGARVQLVHWREGRTPGSLAGRFCVGMTEGSNYRGVVVEHRYPGSADPQLGVRFINGTTSIDWVRTSEVRMLGDLTDRN